MRDTSRRGHAHKSWRRATKAMVQLMAIIVDTMWLAKTPSRNHNNPDADGQRAEATWDATSEIAQQAMLLIAYLYSRSLRRGARSVARTVIRIAGMVASRTGLWIRVTRRLSTSPPSMFNDSAVTSTCSINWQLRTNRRMNGEIKVDRTVLPSANNSVLDISRPDNSGRGAGVGTGVGEGAV